jgi:hypothetical protein
MRGGQSEKEVPLPPGLELHTMHDLAIAATFILIVLSPCFVAARVGIEAEMAED